MNSLTLCLNCLENGARPRSIGPEKGNQMDPYRDTIDLCIECWDALSTGKMRVFNNRYRDSRQIDRDQ